jgi:polar amino acid transport system substrate-binding protein
MSGARILARVLRVTATAVVIGCVLVSTASAQTPVLRWGADAEGGAPFVEADPEHPDRLRGFDVEIAELLAKALGRTPLFVQAAFTALDQSVKRGDFDVAINGLEDSPAKRAELAVSEPYSGRWRTFAATRWPRSAPRSRGRSSRRRRAHTASSPCRTTTMCTPTKTC